jgi:hypothetical protein
LCRLFAPFFRQVAISSRDAAAEKPTWHAIGRHGIPLDAVQLRATGDERASGLMKADKVNQLKAAGYNVLLFIEDWPDVAAVIRTHANVPVLVVNPCYPDRPGWGAAGGIGT